MQKLRCRKRKDNYNVFPQTKFIFSSIDQRDLYLYYFKRTSYYFNESVLKLKNKIEHGIAKCQSIVSQALYCLLEFLFIIFINFMYLCPCKTLYRAKENTLSAITLEKNIFFDSLWKERIDLLAAKICMYKNCWFISC